MLISQIQSAILAPRCPPPLEPSPPLWRLQPARLLPIDGVAHFAFAVGAFFFSFPVCLVCVCGHGMWLCFWLSLSLCIDHAFMHQSIYTHGHVLQHDVLHIFPCQCFQTSLFLSIPPHTYLVFASVEARHGSFSSTCLKAS